MDIYKLAEYLPEGGHWGDPIWPRDVEHIVQAATAAEREACAKLCIGTFELGGDALNAAYEIERRNHK